MAAAAPQIRHARARHGYLAEPSTGHRALDPNICTP